MSISTAEGLALVEAACAKHGFRLQPRATAKAWDVFVFGVRNKSRVADAWDDVVCFAWNDASGARHLRVCKGTTDPGLPYLLDPTASRGTAVLAPGQHRGSHRLGFHHAGKPNASAALVQVQAVPVYRDADKDADIETTGTPVLGFYGINLHRAYRRGLTKVGESSAGCQVWWDERELEELLVLVGKQRDAGMGETVSYTLFDARQDPELLALWGLILSA